MYSLLSTKFLAHFFSYILTSVRDTQYILWKMDVEQGQTDNIKNNASLFNGGQISSRKDV